jgi:hypothetical protein
VGEPYATSIGESVESSNYVEIYPNPVDDFIFINTDLNEIFSYNIYSVKGDIVKSGFVSNDDCINVHELHGGVYFLNLINKSQSTYNLKMIKK